MQVCSVVAAASCCPQAADRSRAGAEDQMRPNVDTIPTLKSMLTSHDQTSRVRSLRLSFSVPQGGRQTGFRALRPKNCARLFPELNIGQSSPPGDVRRHHIRINLRETAGWFPAGQGPGPAPSAAARDRGALQQDLHIGLATSARHRARRPKCRVLPPFQEKFTDRGSSLTRAPDNSFLCSTLWSHASPCPATASVESRTSAVLLGCVRSSVGGKITSS